MSRWGVLSAAVLIVARIADADTIAQSVIDEQYDRLSPSVCMVKYSSEVTNPQNGEVSKRDTRALGLIVSSSGLVMSHGHMKRENNDPFNIAVVVGHGEDSKEYDARLLQKPDDVNVVFLQIESESPLNLPFARFTSRSLRVGEPLLLIGVLGETLDYSPTAVIRRVGAILEKPRLTYCIDERVLFGFVGGPAVNARGEIVGVVGFDLSPAEGGDLYIRSGHPLVYQTALFKPYIDNPPDEETPSESVDDAFLGVFSQPLTDDLARYWGLPAEGGIVIGTVIAGSPAERAGLQEGDVITTFNGTRLRAKADREVVGFTKLVRDAGIGSTVPVRLIREGETMDLTITLEGRPKTARDAGEFVDEVFGLTVREITQDVRILLNLEEGVEGVIVRRVRSGSYASLGRMRPGVIILRFGDHPVTNIEEFEAAVNKVAEQKPAEVPVFCRVGARTGFFRLQPRWE